MIEAPPNKSVMSVQVLVKPQPQGGFQAAAFDLAAEGQTQDEAAQRLRKLLEAHLAGGAMVAFVDVALTAGQSYAWRRLEGFLEDEPLFDAWQTAIEKRRRERDADPNAL